MMNQKELEEYSLKIKKVSHFQEEANKYKRKTILSGIIAGANMLLSINSLITSNIQGKNATGFIGYFLHIGLMGLAFTYMYEMKEKKEDFEKKVATYKKDIENYKNK